MTPETKLSLTGAAMCLLVIGVIYGCCYWLAVHP